MPITMEQDGAQCLLRLDGAIGIECAAELKEYLVRLLKSGLVVRVSLEKVTGLDVTAIQLLWAASRQAKTAGVEFAIGGQELETVQSAYANAGLEEFPVHA